MEFLLPIGKLLPVGDSILKKNIASICGFRCFRKKSKILWSCSVYVHGQTIVSWHWFSVNPQNIHDSVTLCALSQVVRTLWLGDAKTAFARTRPPPHAPGRGWCFPARSAGEGRGRCECSNRRHGSGRALVEDVGRGRASARDGVRRVREQSPWPVYLRRRTLDH